MANTNLIIRYEGARASGHQVDMRQLGRSLLGLERIVSIGLYSIETGKVPPRVRRVPILIRASEPRQSSFEICSALAVIPALLPMIHEAMAAGGAELVWRFVNAILARFSNRKNEAALHTNRMFDLLSEVEGNRHEEIMGMQRLMERLILPARELVSPIGESCDHMSFRNGNNISSIDLEAAHKIRSREKLEVRELQRIPVRIDGFTHHNHQLKISFPEEPGRFLSAIVQDPRFNEIPNIYTVAAANQEALMVLARPVYKDGRIHQLLIVDADRLS